MVSKTWQFIDKLATRSEAGKVGWEKTADEGVYQASFPDYTVRVFERTGASSGIDYVLQILDGEGSVIEENSDVDFEYAESFKKMSALYKNARRKAMGVDHALDKLLKSLDDDSEVKDPDIQW